jgi:hypothetical protein
MSHELIFFFIEVDFITCITFVSYRFQFNHVLILGSVFKCFIYYLALSVRETLTARTIVYYRSLQLNCVDVIHKQRQFKCCLLLVSKEKFLYISYP